MNRSEKWANNIQAAAYNGARTVYDVTQLWEHAKICISKALDNKIKCLYHYMTSPFNKTVSITQLFIYILQLSS